MIPIRLCIEGIYSYRERAEIDFTRLCNARLFGIFGPVGSGKSTILEAITFALYGETERMNSREGRAYNMMNLKSSRLWIDFEFQAGATSHDRYRFTVEVKRNSKDFSNVGTPKRLAFKWEGGDWLPLPDTKAETLIGISYENFIKTVIIPQGRFQDFLGMSATDRTRMLKELFDLQRFDLSAQTKKLSDANNAAMENLRGRLGENKEVQQEDLDLLSEQRKLTEQQLTTSLQAQKENDAAIQVQEHAKNLSRDIEQLKGWIQGKEVESAGIDEREKRLKRYADADAQLRDLLESEQKLTHDLEAAKYQFTTLQTRLNEAKPKLETAEPQFLAAKNDLERRESLEETARAMEAMGKMRAQENEIKICEGRLVKGRETVTAQLETVSATRSKIEAQEIHVAQLQKQIPDLHKLMELLQWQTNMAVLTRQLNAQQTATNDAKTGIDESETALKTLSPNGLPPLEAERQSLNEQLAHTRANLDRLRTHQRLIEFASQLQDGQACPLCGALEHPHPMSESGNEQAFEAENTRLKELDAKIQAISEQIRQYSSVHERLEDRRKQFSSTQAGVIGILEQISQLNSMHQWPEQQNWTIEETQTAYNSGKTQTETLKKAANDLESLRKTIQTQEADLQKFETAILRIESDQNQYRAILKTHASSVDAQLYESLNPQPDDYFQAEAERIRSENDRIQKAFIEIEKQLNALREQVRDLETEIRLSHLTIQTLTAQTEETTSKLATRLTSLGFQTREEVAVLLQRKLDIDAERREIDRFRKEMIEKKATLDAKIQSLGTQFFDEVQYQQLTQQQKEIQGKIAFLQQEIGRIDNQVKQLTEQQQRHAALIKDLDKLTLRQKDLKVMEGLFKADGFVNWVSTVYLKELCHRANLRFQTLTRNRLSLEISSDNAFLVRDMLNDGQTRSVKTLSGGQTFQAALCLALALADNIHARNQNIHNFFFLDEGFGSLDRDSLQVVFDTLKSLQRENRVVGVISHVEEMQQEIDVALRITVDEERGSLVEAV